LWHPVVYLLVTAVVVDFIPDFFVRSYLSSLSGIHIGLILLSYLLGTLVFGWYGLLLGPVILVFAVHYAHQIFPQFASRVTFTFN
jgi:predicted PurR-regulated permease PerM